MIRLDKFLCDTLNVTRKQANELLKKNRIQLEEIPVKNGSLKIHEDANVTFDGMPLSLTGLQYFMMNKPTGYVCSHDDPHHPSVFLLMDDAGAHKLHIAGRLDCDTTGLLLLTNDGQWSHRVTSPKHKCEKTYHVYLADPIAEHAVSLFAEGVRLRGEKQDTLPATLTVLAEKEALLTIKEGKYHQIKRMFAATGNKVVGLDRVSIGGLTLDDDLALGEYRALTAEEVQLFLPDAG